ncbi:MAG: nuclear transport factor 2 family protein [Kofleriaceae bacterium]
MLTAEFADHFVAEWISAWNAHDLERILAHWAEPCTFTSPLVARLMGEPTGTVHGLAALRAYWARGLAANPDLRFELDRVLVGHDSLVIAYRNHRGQHAGEWLRLDGAGRAVAGVAHYR